VSYISGGNVDFNFFVMMGITKLLVNGDLRGAFWITYGNLKPLRLGQWYTQFAANQSNNESGFIVSLGLFGLKVGNISNADPGVTIERFTGLKITFKIKRDDTFPILWTEKCLYIGFARLVYEGDIPD
jgi:hypothetical protein